MKQELEEQFFERFPKLFPNGRNVNPMESLMVYGFECDEGWKNLLWCLCLELEENGNTFIFEQIKEKFALLRCYGHSMAKDDSDFKIVNHYENLSATVCEYCGRDGMIRKDLGWYKTLCITCYEKKKQSKKRKVN